MRLLLRRSYLNVRGFLAALVATLLPSASPYVRKLLAQILTLAAIWIHARLGVEYAASDELNELIAGVVEIAMGTLGAFAVWRVPNRTPPATAIVDPIVRAATQIPSR